MKYIHIWFLVSLLMTGSCSRQGKHENTARTADTAAVNNLLLRLSLHEIANPDSAMKAVLRASALAGKIDYPEGVARALFEHGNLLYQKNRYNEALGKYTAALNMAKQLDMTLVSADCLERMASVHLATDDPSLALKLYYDALLLYEKAKDSLGIAKVYNILGVYKTEVKEYDSAMVFFGRAIAINEQATQQYPLIENRGNLAYMYERMGELDKAELIFNDLAEELTVMKDSLALPATYFNLASIYQEKGKFDTTLFFLDKAIRIAEPVKDTVLLCTLYGNKGEIFLKTGKYDSASWYLSKSVAFARAIDDVETEAQALTFVLRVDSVKGDVIKALEVVKRIIVLNDTNARRHLRNNLNSSKLHYENEKRKSLIELQQQKIESADKQRVLHTSFMVVLLIAILLVGFMLVLERRNRKKKQIIDQNLQLIRDLEMEKIRNDREIDLLKLEKIEAELISRERELLIHAMGIEQKNELLNDIIKQFRDTMANRPETDHETAIGEIISSIKLHLNVSGETLLFNQQFSTVHDKFQNNLKKAHPGLTKSELKFCAYLRMNISGSQIATSLNITSEAIRKTRYRIRKKMELNPRDSLEDYLSSF